MQWNLIQNHNILAKNMPQINDINSTTKKQNSMKQNATFFCQENAF